MLIELQRAKKIQRLSRILRYTMFGAFIILPLFAAGFWMTDGYSGIAPWLSSRWLPVLDNVEVPPFNELDNTIKFLAFLVNMIPISIHMLVLFFLALLFMQYEQLQIFSEKSVKTIRKVGYTLLLGQCLHPIYLGLLSLVLTISNPPGHRTITVGLGNDQLTLVVVALIIILISWIMEEGRKMHEEQEATV